MPRNVAQVKIFADRQPETVESAANVFLQTIPNDMLGSITHETKVDERMNLVYIIKVNYIKSV